MFGVYVHLSPPNFPSCCFSYDFKPSGTSELEEDEGFSDWSQKLEQRKQRWVGHSWTKGSGINKPHQKGASPRRGDPAQGKPSTQNKARGWSIIGQDCWAQCCPHAIWASSEEQAREPPQAPGMFGLSFALPSSGSLPGLCLGLGGVTTADLSHLSCCRG